MSDHPICGGLSDSAVTQEIVDVVNENTALLNQKIGSNATSFTVVKAKTQCVAGTNYFLHLNSNTGNPYTVTIYVPLPMANTPVQVTHAEAGHNPF